MAFPHRSASLAILGVVAWAVPLLAQLDFESAPIYYNTAVTSDPAKQLQDKLDSGETQLTYDAAHGYLNAVLEQFHVPISSQVLVFSKTSFQLRRINPQTPRAVYFSDDVYIGWVQDGDVVEISAVDAEQGAIFYTLSQTESAHPELQRDRGQCIVCHASSRTSGVPGHLVRSVFPNRSGQPFFGSGTFTTDHRSPFPERWGGWYVSGTHGQMRHMGNSVVESHDEPEKLDVESGANCQDLQEIVNVKPYLSPHSDIVALMVLEHQSRMHNLITRANFETRAALHYDQIMNKAMGRPDDHRSESAQRRIESAAEKLVEYMLFADEFPLTDPVQGTSGFADEFALRGPFDSQGRSLRQLDLTTRLMKYPCSYLIYSRPFKNLPTEVKELAYKQLHEALTATASDDRYAHLSLSDRQAIREILSETVSGLPGYWSNSTGSAP
ncbi:MAG: hypothetical protein KDA60_04405 [Planctomycetales bacterium]|nr:hypothetical protein [Planctomycetales bacterium]